LALGSSIGRRRQIRYGGGAGPDYDFETPIARGPNYLEQFISAAREFGDIRRRRKIEEDRRAKVEAEIRAEEQKAKEAQTSTILNTALRQAAVEAQQPGYQPSTIGMEGGPAARQAAAYALAQPKVQEQFSEAEGKAALERQKLISEQTGEPIAVAKKEQSLREKLLAEAEKFQRARESASERQANARERRARSLEAAQIAEANRQVGLTLAGQRAEMGAVRLAEDPAALYQRAKSQLINEEELRTGVRPPADTIDPADIQRRMAVLGTRAEATAALVGRKIRERPAPGRLPPATTEEDIERAGEVRYVMRPEARGMKYAAWLQALGDPRLAMQMAAEAARQGRALADAAADQPAEAISGRTAPVDSTIRSAGIGSGNRAPAPPSATARAARDRMLMQGSGRAAPPMPAQPAQGPAPTAPLAPAFQPTPAPQPPAPQPPAAIAPVGSPTLPPPQPEEELLPEAGSLQEAMSFLVPGGLGMGFLRRQSPALAGALAQTANEAFNTAMGAPGQLLQQAGVAAGLPEDWRQRLGQQWLRLARAPGGPAVGAFLPPPELGPVEKAIGGRIGEIVTDPMMALGAGGGKLFNTLMQLALAKGGVEAAVQLREVAKQHGVDSEEFRVTAAPLLVDLATLGGMHAIGKARRMAREAPGPPRQAPLELPRASVAAKPRPAPVEPPARPVEAPARPVETAPSDTVTVYRGGGGSGHWTTDIERAASYEPGKTVESKTITRDEFAAGRAEAARQGQPTTTDTWLDANQARGSKPVEAPNVAHEITDEGTSLADLERELGAQPEISAPVPKVPTVSAAKPAESAPAFEGGFRAPTQAEIQSREQAGLKPTVTVPEMIERTGAKPTEGPRYADQPKPSRWRIPGIEQIRRMLTPSKEPVGARIAEGIEGTRDYSEAQAGKSVYTFDRALDQLKQSSKAGFDKSWDRVVDALNGDRPASDLTGPELEMYKPTRAVFNEAKAAAVDAGTYSGQEVGQFFPHMKGERASFDTLVDSHLEWMRNTPEGQSRLEALRTKYEDKLGGLDLNAPDRELAATDLQQNYGNEAWYRKYGHLEKARADFATKDWRRDPNVVREYLQGAWDRIAYGRFLGPKSELGKLAGGQLSPEQRSFIADQMKQSFGYKQPDIGGPGPGMIAREFRALLGLTKLGLAPIRQIAQGAVPSAKAFSYSGARSTWNMLRAAKGYIFAHGKIAQDAVRAGSTAPALRKEITERFGGAEKGTYVEWLLTFGGKSKTLNKFVRTTYGMELSDKAVRQYSDRLGRLTFIDVIRRKNRAALEEMLGSKELADKALSLDPNGLEQGLRQGTLGQMRFQAGPKGGVTTEATRMLGDTPSALMDRFAQRFANMTNFRTRAENIPLAWNKPGMKVFNTFMAYPYQHWRWQVSEATKWNNARKAGNRQAMGNSARALLSYHTMFAPMWGGMALYAQSLLKGRGLNEEDLSALKEEASTPQELLRKGWQIFSKISGTKPLDTRDAGALGLVLQGLQAWQYAGGFGYPQAILERGARTFNLSGEEFQDTGRRVAGFLGAPAQTIYDLGKGATDFIEYLANMDDKRKYTPAKVRQLYRGWIEAIGGNILPNPYGLGRAVLTELKERVAPSKNYPNVSPGWLGFLFGTAEEWTPEHGVTSAKAEMQRQAIKALEERKRRRARLLRQRPAPAVVE